MFLRRNPERATPPKSTASCNTFRGLSEDDDMEKEAWNYFSVLGVCYLLFNMRERLALKYVLVNGLIVADVTSNAYDCIIASVLSFKSASRRRTIATRLSAHRILMLHDNESGMDTLVNSNTAFTCSSIEDFLISVFQTM